MISKQCVNGHREIRQRAISYLQRLLLSPQLMSADESTLPLIFDRVLFPVLDEMLKPAVYERDPAGAVEMRLRAATLLCKVFLQHVVGLQEEASTVVGNQFVRVLDKLERFMQGDRDLLVSGTGADKMLTFRTRCPNRSRTWCWSCTLLRYSCRHRMAPTHAQRTRRRCGRPARRALSVWFLGCSRMR